MENIHPVCSQACCENGAVSWKLRSCKGFRAANTVWLGLITYKCGTQHAMPWRQGRFKVMNGLVTTREGAVRLCTQQRTQATSNEW